MIKFGVPTPEAAWAMTAGVPVRELAIRIGSRYRRGETPYRNFLVWLNTIEVEQLLQEYGLESPLLEDVSRALIRATANPLLQQDTDPLANSVEVIGIWYGERRNTARLARQGTSVKLTRDYDNLVDRNAVLVELEGRQLGYLPRSMSQYLAPEMDSGERFVGTVETVSDAVIPKVEIRLSRAEN